MKRHPPSPALHALARAVQRFLSIEASSAIVLLGAAGAALVWANSPWASAYEHLWHMATPFTFGTTSIELSPHWFVNDALMAIFFFVVGLEIRAELHHGELATVRRAALPAIAALGGMLAPAALYVAIAGAAPTRAGWGVPMATDIAFAVGILTLLGSRVPAGLRVLLLALAVIDDLGAIVVIGLFYSSGIHIGGLVIAAAGLAFVLVLQRLKITSVLAYGIPALIAWGGTVAAGIHPTIAGVILGLMTPVIASSSDTPSPAERLTEQLHPWVAYAIMPVFALANAGVQLESVSLQGPSLRVFAGVTAGLVLGKPLGVLGASAIALSLRFAQLPPGLHARHVLVLGVVAGVGFTMALFIAQLAFTDAAFLGAAKLAVLAASGASAVGALVLGRLLLARPSA